MIHVALQGGVSYLLVSYFAKICLEHYRSATLSRAREALGDNGTIDAAT